ncbi:MAG: AsmA protein [Methylophagaceae bacterium]|jgi:AsmA protein
MRILLKFIAFIVIIVIIGLIALPLIVDPNDYKQQISDQVEKATGRTLNLEGDIRLSVFPWIALELGPLSLSNAAGFDAKDFAKIDGAQLRIKLIPLLKKELEMDTIILDGLALNLEKNKAGKTNWDDLDGPAEQKADVKESANAEPALGLAALTIAGVELTNANIAWSDKSNAAQYVIKNLNLKTDPLEPGQSTSVALDFNLASGQQWATKVSLTTNLTADVAKQLYTLKQLKLNTVATGEGLPLPEIALSLNGDVLADLNLQTADFSGLLLQIQDIAVEVDIKAKKILSEKPQFSGQIAVKAFNLKQLAEQLAVELPVMTDTSTMELVQLSSQLSGSTDHLSLDDLSIIFDQSQLTGQFSVRNFADPALKFKLALDSVDADRYMPLAEDKAEETIASPATAGAVAASELPLETLRDLNITGSLKIGQLKISNTQSNNINININAKDGVVKLHPLSADLYQGQYQGNVSLDARGKSLKLSINEILNNIQAGPLLRDLSGDDKISGLVNAKVKLIGRGKTVVQIKQTLSGNGDFSFTDGALKGINIADSIRKAKALLKGEPLPKSMSAVKTDFSTFKGSFTTNNGLINNPDLVLMSPLLRISGAGTADLNKEAINYVLAVAVVGSSEGQEGKGLAELKGLVIPIKISGGFNNPAPTVDLASLLRDNATQKIKDKVTDKLKDKLGGGFGDIVGGALLGSKKPTANDDAENSDEPSVKSIEDELKESIGGKLKGFF